MRRLALLLLLATACDDGGGTLDAGLPPTDAGAPPIDVDAGVLMEDASTFSLSDSSVPSIRGAETPEEALDWWVARLNEGRRLTRSEIEANLGPGYSEDDRDGTFHPFFEFWSDRVSHLGARVERTLLEPDRITGLYETQTPMTRFRVTLRVVTDFSSRAQIINIQHQLEEPPPGPDEIELYGFGFTPSTTTDNTMVELLDRETFAPFDPPARGTLDQFERVRLTVPPGVGEVAVRTTHPDGSETVIVDPRFQRGVVNSVEVLEEWSSYQSASRVDIEYPYPSGTAQVVVPISSEGDGEDRLDVGCATLETDPPARVYYGEGGGLPVLGRTETDRRASLGWLYNLEPGPRRFTSRAGVAGSARVASDVILFPDTVHIVRLRYLPPDHPTNPTPPDCP